MNQVMNYWIAFVIENNTRWYLSHVDPSTNRRSKDESQYAAYYGPEQACRFNSKEQAMDAVAMFCEDKPQFKLAGLAEINVYPLLQSKKPEGQ